MREVPRGFPVLAGLFAIAIVAACAGSPAAPGRSTADPRVKSFAGQTPPDVLTDGTWVARAGPTSLAALRGRVVYLQFAFPQ